MPARPVSLFSVVFVLALFALFLLVIRWTYQPATVSPQNAAAENLPKDQEWRATVASRRKALEDQKAKEAAQAASYAWVDQNAGVVQLPIDRAMELTAQKYGARK
jgi:cbb3-type cytochrome oxidase subunit 3